MLNFLYYYPLTESFENWHVAVSFRIDKVCAALLCWNRFMQGKCGISFPCFYSLIPQKPRGWDIELEWLKQGKVLSWEDQLTIFSSWRVSRLGIHTFYFSLCKWWLKLGNVCPSFLAAEQGHSDWAVCLGSGWETRYSMLVIWFWGWMRCCHVHSSIYFTSNFGFPENDECSQHHSCC